MSKIFTKEFWKKGSGTCFYGVLIIYAAILMCYYIYSTFLAHYGSIVAQTRSDIIADAVAVTLSNTDFTDDDIKAALDVADKLIQYNSNVLSSDFKLSYRRQIDKNARTVGIQVDVFSTALNYASNGGSAQYSRYSIVEVLNKSETYYTSDSFDYPDNPRDPCTPMFSIGTGIGAGAEAYWNCAVQFPLSANRYRSSSYNNDITLLRDIMAVYYGATVVLPWDTMEEEERELSIEVPVFGTLTWTVTVKVPIQIDNYYEYIDEYIDNGSDSGIKAFENRDGTYEWPQLTDTLIEKSNQSAASGNITAILFSDGKIYIILPPTDEARTNSYLSYMCASESVTAGQISKSAINAYLSRNNVSYKIIYII